nr:L285 [uncultured bacterium]
MYKATPNPDLRHGKGFGKMPGFPVAGLVSGAFAERTVAHAARNKIGQTQQRLL